MRPIQNAADRTVDRGVLSCAATTAARRFTERKVEVRRQSRRSSPQALAMKMFAKSYGRHRRQVADSALPQQHSWAPIRRCSRRCRAASRKSPSSGRQRWSASSRSSVSSNSRFSLPPRRRRTRCSTAHSASGSGSARRRRPRRITYWENGFRSVTNSRRPITRLDELSGVKLRVMQNAVALDAFRAIGANPVPMAFSELFTALETRTVDGQENPLVIIQTSRFYEVQKYLTISRHVYTPLVVLAGKKWWDGLSADEKKVVQDVGGRTREYQRRISREMVDQSLQDLRAKGMQINELSRRSGEGAGTHEAGRRKVQPVDRRRDHCRARPRDPEGPQRQALTTRDGEETPRGPPGPTGLRLRRV